MCSWPSAGAQIQENPFEPDGRLQKREVPDRLWVTKITYLLVRTTSENTTKNLTIHRPESVFNPPSSSFPSSQGSIYWEGRGEASPPNVSAPPRSFTEKNLQLFQINIFFDDDFKESVKVTNVQKCDFSQILNTIFSKFSGGACPGPP